MTPFDWPNRMASVAQLMPQSGALAEQIVTAVPPVTAIFLIAASAGEKNEIDLPSGEKAGLTGLDVCAVPGTGRASCSDIVRRYSCEFAT